MSLVIERVLPEKECSLAGYAALVAQYQLNIPLPHKLACISLQHRQYQTPEWAVYTPRYKPASTLQGHLTFALRYEGVDLGILKVLFAAIEVAELEAWVRNEPTGKTVRRVWFLYEWLMGQKLDLPDAERGNFVEILGSQQQFALQGVLVRRQRVRNNLPGTPGFCPLIQQTEKLQAFIKQDIRTKARAEFGAVHPDLLARAAAFLLLKDSRASFAIEGETPTYGRAERWGRALGHAGTIPLSLEELVRLQKIVIDDTRFVKLGLRKEEGFIGTHDRATGLPIPDHISARAEDVESLMLAFLETYALLKQSEMDPILQAVILAFGFVFIHPFVDGNGRIHRYIIHHILAEGGLVPPGIIFPISAMILEYVETYRQVLESYSRPRLPFIQWRPSAWGNVEIVNPTSDLYRYFDATTQAEFLYMCVIETIERLLPQEIQYLACYDRMKTRILERFDMPDSKVTLLIRFLDQNQGIFSKRAQEKEFTLLTAQERTFLEALYQEIFKH